MNVIELWWLSLAIFAVVVVVVAVLLGLIIAAAKSIDRHAAAIWTAGKQIAGNTVSIWMLEQTNEQVTGMLNAARSLERVAASIDEKLLAIADTGKGRR
jgi:ABC-type spermidine/putrescine transport system permease subunit II